MKGRLGPPLIFGSIAVIMFAAIAAAFPIHLTTKSGVSEAQVREGIWERIPTSVPGRVEIDNTGDGPVKIGFPALRFPEIFTPDLIEKRKGVYLDETGQILEIEAGGFVSLSGVFGDLDLALVPGQTSARLEVIRTSVDGTTSYLLTPERPAVSLQSPRFRFERTLPFLWRTVDPGRAVGEGPVIATIGRSEAVLGPREALAIGSSLPLVAESIGRGLLVVAAAVALMFWFWLLGRALSGRGDRQWLHAVNLAGGFALSAAIANSLSYLLPVKFVLPLIAALWVAVLIFGIRRGNLVLDQLKTEAMNLGGMAGLALIPAAVLFLPMFFLGSPFLGGFNTDLTAQSSQASSLVTDHSLLAMRDLRAAQNAGLIPAGLGFEWRSVDVVAVALASLGFGNSLAAYELVCVLLFLLYSVGLLSALGSWGSNLWGRALVILLLFFPPFLSLFLASYWAQLFFVALIPALILGGVHLLRAPESGGTTPLGPILLMASLVAASILSFAFFAVLVFGGIAVGLLSRAWCGRQRAPSAPERHRGSSNSWRTWGIMLGASLLLIGPGLISLVLSAAEADNYPRLNEIATNVLLSPYDLSQTFGLVTGVVPYGWRQFAVDPSPFMGGVGGRVWELASDSWDFGLLGLLAVLLPLAILLLGLKWKETIGRPTVAAAAATVVFMGTLGGLAALGGETYLTLKLIWTALCVIPILLISVQFRSKVWMRGFVICLIPITTLWVRVDLADRATWLFHGTSTAAQDTYTPIQQELVTVRRLIEGQEPRRALILEGNQPIAGSDRDITIGHQAVLILRDLGITCIGCDSYRPRSACDPAADLIITVGKAGFTRRCGLSRIYSGDEIDLYGR